MVDHEPPLGDADAELWEDEDERVWEEDHAGRLSSHAAQLDARAGRLLTRVPAVSFGAVALNDTADRGSRDPEWFPGVKLLARTPDEYRLLVDLRGLLVTAAGRAGIGRLILRSPGGETVDLFDATDSAPQDLIGAVEVLDVTPQEAMSEWAVPPGEVDGFHLTSAEAAVYNALQDMDLLFTPQCWVLNKGRRLYHLDFVVYHRGRTIAIEVDEEPPQASSEETVVRERFLHSRGLDVVHLGAEEIRRDLKAAMLAVVEALESRS